MDTSGALATLLAVLAGVAFYAAARVNGRGEAGRRAASGYVVFGVAAALQTGNLLVGYGVFVAAVAGLGLVGGLVLIARAWAGRTAPG